MKPILILLLSTFFLMNISYSQVPPYQINQRAPQSITAQDARLSALYNLFQPIYDDTTAANLQLGIDSCGAIIYTRLDNSMWMRGCNPKQWGKMFPAIITGTGKTNGTATLSSGIVVISTTAVRANSIIIVSYDTPSGTLSAGLCVPSVNLISGVSFTIKSILTTGLINTADNSTVKWRIVY